MLITQNCCQFEWYCVHYSTLCQKCMILCVGAFDLYIEYTKLISKFKYYIDRFHLRNHQKKCKQQFNINNASEDLKDINTQICEQTFSWFSQFKRVTRHMNGDNFMVFVLCMCHFHNKKQMQKLTESGKVHSS